MAETRKITIEILTTTKEKNNSQNDDSEISKSDLRSILHPIKNLEKSVLGKNVFINQAYEQAKNVISNAVGTSINQYFNLSEDYLGENTYNQIKKTFSKGASLGNAVVSGAMVAGVGGALASATGWLFTEMLSNQTRMSNYYRSLNETNYNTQFSRVRSGLIDNGKGTEN